MATSGRNYTKKNPRLNKYLIADDMIRVGFFGADPLRYLSLRRTGDPLRLADFVGFPSQDAAQALNGTLRIGRYPKAPFEVSEGLEAALSDMIGPFLAYSDRLEVRSTDIGLGVYFRRYWRKGTSLGLKDNEGNWLPGYRISFQGPYAAHDGHSVARSPKSTADGSAVRPFEFVGLGAFLNHGCKECANFQWERDGCFAPFLCEKGGRAGKEALVFYSEHEDLPCRKCRRVSEPY